MVSLSIIKRKMVWELRKRWALAQYPFRKRQLLESLERSIASLSVETTNICNANCIFCAYQYQERATGVMSQDLFRKIVDEYVEMGGGHLGLTPTVGDPLVDQHLASRIQYAKSKPQITSIGMYSNMISLDRIGLDVLLHSGITHIVVSTSGFDEEMYKRVYRSQMYKQMLENVKRFAAANNAAGQPVDFQIDMRVDRPYGEVIAMPDYKGVADLVGSEKIGVKFRYDSWAGYITPDQLTGNMKLRHPKAHKPAPCSELYSGPMVYWDGKVGACGCRDINASELIIGDVSRSHLGDIWFGEEIRKLRDEFTTDKIKPICDTCTHYNSVAVMAMNPNLVNIKQANYSGAAASSPIGA